MAILVDQARWPWRGTTWCHLVSDSHLDELHDFAGVLGCRRVSFQGDHYDIDIDTRRIAVEIGAIECDSRELVRRLKAAGLRLRPSGYVKWELDYRIDSAVDDDVWSALVGRHPHVNRVVDLEPGLDGFHRDATGCFVLKRGDAEAVAVHGQGELHTGIENPTLGVFVRHDRFGAWSVESFSPAPSREG
ncbi:MAG: DUF4031 domain-containing protein [Acidimicrobiia bacterium]|nr:DUF4031 domain-containing protein [Acidimicrobiia bacterium]